jgi:hypothetical protein
MKNDKHSSKKVIGNDFSTGIGRIFRDFANALIGNPNPTESPLNNSKQNTSVRKIE